MFERLLERRQGGIALTLCRDQFLTAGREPLVSGAVAIGLQARYLVLQFSEAVSVVLERPVHLER